MLLEIIAETLEDAREAEQGGAERIELVRDLDRDGLTPPLAVIEAVVRAVRIPVRVMLRESEPFVLGDPHEPARLHRAAVAAYTCGAAGLVAGFIRDGRADLAAVGEVLGTLAAPMTFHRAFDSCDDPLDALAALSQDRRIDRVLTSGGSGAWPVRLARLALYRLRAPSHLQILPGGGLDGDALRALAVEGFREAHVGRAARIPPQPAGRVRAVRVAELAAIVRGGAA